MVEPQAPRNVVIERTAAQSYRAHNGRGGVVEFGHTGAEFTPVELLLAALGGCSGIDVDMITGKRAEPSRFEIRVSGDRVRDDRGNHLQDIRIVFDLAFPAGEAGDAARAVLPEAIRRSHDRLCTVSRTVELGTPVAMGQAEAPVDAP